MNRQGSQVEAKAVFVRRMFGDIAARYDLLNSVLSFGLDAGWRRFAVAQCRLTSNGLALDAATGTGALARCLARQDHEGTVVAVDFSPQMLAGARNRMDAKYNGGQIHLAMADVLRLPFPDDTFDSITMGFALRNVDSIQKAFEEMARVAKPGGRVVCIELTRPSASLPRALHSLYLRHIGRRIGSFISGNKEAYAYLPDSIRRFPPDGEVQQMMETAGLARAQAHHLALGAATVYVGVKDAVRSVAR